MLNYQTVRFDRAYGTVNQLKPSTYPEIAFIGRSNVGKSSLMNAIFRRKNLVKTSATPGKTTSINFFPVDKVNFVDLPGYAYAKRSKAERKRIGELIDGYFESGRRIALTFLLIDIRHDVMKSDIIMASKLMENEIPFAIIFTKADKLSKAKGERQMRELCGQLNVPGDTVALSTSVTKKTGINEVRSYIEEALRK